MRSGLAVVVAGGLSGVIAAGLAAWIVTTRERAPLSPEGGREAPLAIAVPPSWNPRFVGRLSSVESRLASLEQTPRSPERLDAPAPREGDLTAQHQRDVAEQYENDLRHQQLVLQAHDLEPRDDAWAGQQSDVITEMLGAANKQEHPYKLEHVDCRSTTCVAEVVYPTPEEALLARGTATPMTARNCHGLSSALEPPKGPGSYTVKFVYYCR